MKFIVISIILCAHLSAYAKNDSETCTLIGMYFQIAVHQRDAGVPPENFLKKSSEDGIFNEIPLKTKKEIINGVYFRDDMQNINGEDLGRQVYSQCMLPKNRFSPIK